MGTRPLVVVAIIVMLLALIGFYWSQQTDRTLLSQGQEETSLTRITFATDWKAQAEQGGFYQAAALGLYEARGLDVKIIQGGPSVNIPQLLAAGAIDFGMGSNSFIPLNLIAAGAPVKAVMASFQKDPQVLITHQREDISSIADMSGHPIMISDAAINSFWVWLKVKHSFTDQQIRKYTFNLAPFMVDETAIQQGYLSSEPYSIETAGGKAPQVFLMADDGYPGYGCFILAPTSWIEQEPELVQAFVEATIDGWKSYLYDDPTPGNQAIMKDNPDMTEEMLAQAILKLRSYGIIDSGDTETLGIGAMTHERWQEFFEVMSANGVYDEALDYRSAYTLRFINQGYALSPGS